MKEGGDGIKCILQKYQSIKRLNDSELQGLIDASHDDHISEMPREIIIESGQEKESSTENKDESGRDKEMASERQWGGGSKRDVSGRDCHVSLAVRTCLLGHLPGTSLLLMAIRGSVPGLICIFRLGTRTRIARRSSTHWILSLWLPLCGLLMSFFPRAARFMVFVRH